MESIKSTAAGAQLTFAEIGADAVKKAGGSAQVDWRQVEDAAIAKSLKDGRQPADDVYRAIASASPGALTDQHSHGAVDMEYPVAIRQIPAGGLLA